MADVEAEILSSWIDWQADLASRPEIVQPLTAGTSHRSLLLSALSASGNTQYFVLRIDNNRSRELAMSASQEMALMQRAGPLAPKIVFRNSLALVSEFIDAPQWRPPRHLRTLATRLSELHQLQVPAELPPFDLLRHCDAYWQQLRQPQQHQQLFHQSRSLLRQALQKYSHRCLCHNDLNPANILIDNENFALLDWEYAATNSPYFDLASLAEFGALDDQSLHEFCCHYYGRPHDLESHPYDLEHLAGIRTFRAPVRLLQWLWLSLQGQRDLAEESRSRLVQLGRQAGYTK